MRARRGREASRGDIIASLKPSVTCAWLAASVVLTLEILRVAEARRRRGRAYRLTRSHFRAGEIGKERGHVAMLPLDDAGEFRAKLKREPEAADPHILDAVA